MSREWLNGIPGVRLRLAFARHFDAGAHRVVIIGTDCPGITCGILERAFAALRTTDVVLGPAVDGGSGRVLGVHAVAPYAGELLGEATLAVRRGLTIGELAETLHPYLTWVESLKLAAQSFAVDVSRLSCCA